DSYEDEEATVADTSRPDVAPVAGSGGRKESRESSSVASKNEPGGHSSTAWSTGREHRGTVKLEDVVGLEVSVIVKFHPGCRRQRAKPTAASSSFARAGAAEAAKARLPSRDSVLGRLSTKRYEVKVSILANSVNSSCLARLIRSSRRRSISVRSSRIRCSSESSCSPVAESG
uniref:DUF1336 domain-containing protein n=1 Tax=Macrostomum lignano TaxID=282301 RepID=A0A1I8FPX8_9PLAT